MDIEKCGCSYYIIKTTSPFYLTGMIVRIPGIQRPKPDKHMGSLFTTNTWIMIGYYRVIQGYSFFGIQEKENQLNYLAILELGLPGHSLCFAWRTGRRIGKRSRIDSAPSPLACLGVPGASFIFPERCLAMAGKSQRTMEL